MKPFGKSFAVLNDDEINEEMRKRERMFQSGNNFNSTFKKPLEKGTTSRSEAIRDRSLYGFYSLKYTTNA